MAGALSTRKRKAAQTDDTTPNTEGKRRRKKQGVTKTNSAAVKALIQQNQVNSPLLKLAPEIREKILTYLILHIHHSDEPIFDPNESDEDAWVNKPKPALILYYVCQADTARAYDYDQGQDSVVAEIPAGDSTTYDVEDPNKRHGFCRHLASIGEERHSFHLNLNVLGACRQLYEEANHLLWSTNTFTFNEPGAFRLFFGSLNPAQKRNLTKLAIFADMDTAPRAYGVFWEQAFRPANLKMLQGLTTLSLCFEQRIERWDPTMFGNCEDTKSKFWGGMEAFLLFRMLPFNQVFVTVSDNVSWLVNTERLKGVSGDLVRRWTAAQKIQFAREWEEKLLDPDPAATIEAEEDAAELAARKSSKKAWADILANRRPIANHYQAKANNAAASLKEAQLDPARFTSSMQSSIEEVIKQRKAKAKNTKCTATTAMQALERCEADLPIRIEEEAVMQFSRLIAL